MRHHAFRVLIIASAFWLTGAAPQASQFQESQPSADDFQNAMEHEFGRRTANLRGTILFGDCWHAKNLQCSPARNGRSKCTYPYYRHGRTHRGTAILERNSDASWKWVSGPLTCAVGVSG